MFIQCGDIVIHAAVEGPAKAPTVLLLHSLGTTLHMWDPQAEALARHYRVIRMDMRGHGLSEAPHSPYTMAMLARDALALLDELLAHATQPQYEYRHQWRTGDMVMWDNRCLLHKANGDYDMGQVRYLYRIMLKGDVPV